MNEPRITVAWCRVCWWWLPASDIGTGCPSTDCNRKLVKRRAYRCGDDCEDNIVCFSVRDLREHRRIDHGVAA